MEGLSLNVMVLSLSYASIIDFGLKRVPAALKAIAAIVYRHMDPQSLASGRKKNLLHESSAAPGQN